MTELSGLFLGYSIMYEL